MCRRLAFGLKVLVGVLALIAPGVGFGGSVAGAQEIRRVANGTDFRGRAGVEFEKKIARGLSVNAGLEGRLEENFSAFDRAVASLGLNYKVVKGLKLGAGYDFIYIPGDCRHRAFADVTGSVKFDRFNLSLRERVTCTHKTREDLNLWQQPLNRVDLRSRLKLSYKCFAKPLEPYTFVELKNVMNGSAYATREAESMTYSDIYVDRVRVGLGTEWRLGRTRYLDFYGLADFVSHKKTDADKTGYLKKIKYENGLNVSLGVKYSFKM